MTLSNSIPSNLWVKPLPLARKIFSEAIWKKDAEAKELYLTFDDGPISEVTPWVLDTLKKWNAKATFFCIGKNAAENPDILKRIENEGHSIGNHTYTHVNGWKTSGKIYMDEVQLCDKILANDTSYSSPPLFRPPYGKMKITQYRRLKNNYKIVMWDVLSMDYDLNISKEQVLQNVFNNAENGSIIVFHDSLKAEEKVRFALPKVLEHFSVLGYEFKAL